MSTATSPPTAPAVARSHSMASRTATQRPPSSDLPHRTRSTTTRPPTSSLAQQHSSRSQSYDRRPSSNQGAMTNVVRRDFEQSNVARPPSSRRETSRDRSQERATSSYRTDSSRAHHRHSSSRHNRNGSDMAPSGPQSVVTETTVPSAAHLSNSAAPKRRTMISTPTGQWALGKTIGAGSMGKVKIAKNLDTGDQVGYLSGKFRVSLRFKTL